MPANINAMVSLLLAYTVSHLVGQIIQALVVLFLRDRTVFAKDISVFILP